MEIRLGREKQQEPHLLFVLITSMKREHTSLWSRLCTVTLNILRCRPCKHTLTSSLGCVHSYVYIHPKHLFDLFHSCAVLNNSIVLGPCLQANAIVNVNIPLAEAKALVTSTSRCYFNRDFWSHLPFVVICCMEWRASSCLAAFLQLIEPSSSGKDLGFSMSFAKISLCSLYC